MDITPYFLAFVEILGLWLLWVTGKRASFDRRLKRLTKAQGHRAAWEWYLTTPQWQKARQACFKAFGGRCAECNSRLNLQAHHRRYDHLGHERPIRDLTCLCATCHARSPRSDGLYPG